MKKKTKEKTFQKKISKILCEIQQKKDEKKHEKIDEKNEEKKHEKNDEKNEDKNEKIFEKASRILLQPSLKSKYEELTQETVDYTLPSEYKTLFRLFEAIDETLNFLKMRNLPQFYEEIKENLRLLGLYNFSSIFFIFLHFS